MKYVYPLLIFVALVSACIAAAIGFGWWEMDRYADRLIAWIAVSLGLFLMAEVLAELDKP